MTIISARERHRDYDCDLLGAVVSIVSMALNSQPYDH
jgi:hypothetical protein